eukprot:936526-Pyramimonas_sp.AAC.1
MKNNPDRTAPPHVTTKLAKCRDGGKNNTACGTSLRRTAAVETRLRVLQRWLSLRAPISRGITDRLQE